MSANAIIPHSSDPAQYLDRYEKLSLYDEDDNLEFIFLGWDALNAAPTVPEDFPLEKVFVLGPQQSIEAAYSEVQ